MPVDAQGLAPFKAKSYTHGSRVFVGISPANPKVEPYCQTLLNLGFGKAGVFHQSVEFPEWNFGVSFVSDGGVREHGLGKYGTTLLETIYVGYIPHGTSYIQGILGNMKGEYIEEDYDSLGEAVGAKNCIVFARDFCERMAPYVKYTYEHPSLKTSAYVYDTMVYWARRLQIPTSRHESSVLARSLPDGMMEQLSHKLRVGTRLTSKEEAFLVEAQQIMISGGKAVSDDEVTLNSACSWEMPPGGNNAFIGGGDRERAEPAGKRAKVHTEAVSL